MNRPAVLISCWLVAAVACTSSLSAGSLSEALSLLNEKDGASRAKPLLEKLIAEASSDPDREKAQFYLADCKYRLGHVKTAFWMLSGLSRSASSEHLRAAATLRLAMLQMAQGLETEALSSYETLARQFPESKYAPMAMMVQANYWLLIEGNKRRSLPLYETLIQKYPTSKEAKLASSTLPGLRKMPSAEIRSASRKYVKDMKASQRKQRKKSR